MATIEFDGRHWEVFDDEGNLVAKTVYKVGAVAVAQLSDDVHTLRSQLTQHSQAVTIVHPEDDMKAEPIPIIW